MMRTRHHRSPAILACLAAAVLLPALRAGAEPPPAGSIRIDAKVEVAPTGDARGHIVVAFSPRDYNEVKGRVTNPFQFLREFSSSRADYEMAPGATCHYDDATTAVVMDLCELGAVKNRGDGTWEFPIDRGPEFINKSESGGRTLFTFYAAEQLDNGMPCKGQLIYALPEGAKDAAWDTEKRFIRYQLPFTGGDKSARLKLDFKAKDRLMTAIYKVYGLGVDFAAQWVAKTVISNPGGGVVRNLKIRYRVEGYSEWSMWDKFPEVIPGQTAVSVYYPVLDKSIAALRTNTPANVLVEWKYEDSEGKSKEDSDGKRVVLLGGNEFVFSNLLAGESYGTWHEGVNNAPLIAAWVSRDDPVVKQLAAMGNKNAGGVGASSSDENAAKVLRACYELLQANNFTYQHPPSLADKSISFDVQSVQNVKYPRDTIRDKSGTCIDLAILYAALVNNLGLRSYLALIPGHCFPVIAMPEGGKVGIEVTGVGGGVKFGTAPWAKVAEFGCKELKESLADGRIFLIDLQELWTKGVSNPEMESLPPDILQRWGISEVGAGGGGAAQPPAGGGDQRPQPQPQPPRPGPGANPPGPGGDGDEPPPAQPGGNPPAPGPGPGPQPGGDASAASAFAGQWQGQMSEKLASGQTITYPVYLQIQAAAGGKFAAASRCEADVATQNGGTARIRIEETFDGRLQGNTLMLQGTRKVVSIVTSGQSSQADPDMGVFQLAGGRLVGKIGTDAEGWTEIALTRK